MNLTATLEAWSGSEPWAQWLSRLRIIAITVTLGMEVAARVFTPYGAPLLNYAFGIIAVWYVLAFLHLGLLHLHAPLAVTLQLFFDAALLSALTYVSGGVSTLLSGGAPLLVIAAAAILPRRRLWLLGSVCIALDSAFSELAWLHFIPAPWAEVPTRAALDLSLLLHVLALLAACTLGSLLASRFSAADRQIAAQHAAMESLQALNTNIIRSMSSGLITTDLEGVIHLANPTAATILERPTAEIIGQPLENVLPLGDPAAVGTRAECLVPCGGCDKIIGISANPLHSEDRARVGWILNFQDLTQLRSLEAQVRTRERMSALGRMAAAIAHEIRNPLSAIAGSISLLGGFTELDEDGRRLVEIVRAESQRLNRTLNDFLSYARDYRYRMEWTDLRGILLETETLLRQHPRLGAVQLRLEVGAAPIPVRGDGDRLRQVIWNLADNAFKAMQGSGTLLVRALPSAAGLRLEFLDSGPGVPAELADTIFEPFHSGFEGGTGLGLATCYSIIEAHGGKIWVESGSTGGACFVIQLPRAAEAATAPLA